MRKERTDRMRMAGGEDKMGIKAERAREGVKEKPGKEEYEVSRAHK